MANSVNSWNSAAHTENSSTPAKIHQQTSSISKVKVILRVRPFLPQEISTNGNRICCISTLDKESEISSHEVAVLLKDHESSRNECYKLDAFYAQEVNNVSKIFEREVQPLIPGIFQGRNATVFAYGATGSGKTYTMQGSDQLNGLMPLAMSSILSMCDNTGSSITISYYEIYLDKCYDLLEPKENEIMVWNDKDDQIHLKGLAQAHVNSMSEFHETFTAAIQRRKVAHTGLNDVSSRSHVVLAISIYSPSHDGVGNIVTGKLNLIDLAGNEDNRRTCNEGIRLHESAKINTSLFALSNVIHALNNSMPRIPYRESKLTRILQDSLGGMSRGLMVACLNPGEYQESVYTVSLAARSRHVSNFVSPAQRSSTLKMKGDMEAKLLAWMESKGKAKNAPKTPFTSKTPSSVSSSRKWNASENKVVRNIDVSSTKQRTTGKVGRDLFNAQDHAEQDKEVKDSGGDNVAEVFTTEVGDSSELKTSLPGDESVTDDEKPATIKSIDEISLSPVNEEIEAIQTPQRKALSPITSSTNIENLIPSEPKTPMLHHMSFDEQNMMLETPLDKFTAQSSNMKTSLAQNFVEFLNTASREELLELKGIGQKIADYIIELRETSPLKTLSDLEKLCITSKQVNAMFGKATSAVFEKISYNNNNV